MPPSRWKKICFRQCNVFSTPSLSSLTVCILCVSGNWQRQRNDIVFSCSAPYLRFARDGGADQHETVTHFCGFIQLDALLDETCNHRWFISNVANFCGFTICWLRLVKLATKHNSSDCCTLLWFTICWLPLIKPATTTFFFSSDSCTLLWFYNTPVMLHETHNLRQLIRLLHASVAEYAGYAW